MPKSSARDHFSIDARAIIQLGRESIKHPTTALLELVKNGYDADARLVEVDIRKDSIRIADNGSGMNRDQIESSWLRIGFSEKRVQKLSANNRRKTGEKGIGRLSADRLGSNLDLRSRERGSETQRLLVNWDDFDVEGKNLTEIDVTLGTTTEYNFADYNKKHGTEIVITNLRHTWLVSDIEQTYSELVSLISPFTELDDFKIKFNNYLLPDLNGTIESQYFDVAGLSIDASYGPDNNIVKYKITDRSHEPEVVTTHDIRWNQLSHRTNAQEVEGENLRCGPVKLQLLFYPRTATNPLLEQKGLSAKGLKQFLDRNIGIKIYRDNVSVKPYGYNNEMAGDWLSLARRKERDPAGLSRPTYKIASSQLIGAVSIGRDTNPRLYDGASREGLVENDAFFDLRALVTSCVALLEKYRHEEAVSGKESTKPSIPKSEQVESLRDDLSDLRSGIDRLKKQVADPNTTPELLTQSINAIDQIAERTNEKEELLDELIDKDRALSGLATVGIASAVFGHETQTAISLFKSNTYAAISKLRRDKGPQVDKALIHLDEAVKFADQVDAWGAFGLMRIKRDKRTKRTLNVNEVIERIMDEISKTITSLKVELEVELATVQAKTFAMDIESIILNLLTNAIWACTQNNGARKIKVTLNLESKNDLDGFLISVSDSGPGIDESMLSEIWQPLFTTRKDSFGHEEGTGLGLSIVSSTVHDLGGVYEVNPKSALGGADFRIWIPKS
jgi:hypothetical protein